MNNIFILHRECLGSLVENSTDASIACLLSGCDGYLLDSEVEQVSRIWHGCHCQASLGMGFRFSVFFHFQLTSKTVFKNYIDRRQLLQMESVSSHRVSCFDKSCPGGFVVTAGGGPFKCNACGKGNCIDCKVSQLVKMK